MLKSEAAKLRGVQVFDTALPYNWITKSAEKIGAGSRERARYVYRELFCGVVWNYDEGAFGFPYAVTKSASKLLRILGYNYSPLKNRSE